MSAPITGYAELQAVSNFSFLRGAAHPEELVDTAAALGHHALAIADHNTLAGVVRGHVAARAHDLRYVVASRLDLVDGPSVLALPQDRAAYGRLSRLLSL
ncbi:MAG: PHP domain-containing protein, partial [Pseudomonadota bacterium]|nr:PHP domain-containing protein [Pseudomonadota bacterium]